MSVSHFAAAVMLGLLTVPVAAAPLLNPVFQDHAVLQRGQPVRLWGVAAAGETVTTSIGAVQVSAVADRTGHWSAELPAMPAGGPYSITVRADKGSEQTIRDVLIGDVYLCSGQSNMAYPVMGALDAGSDIQVSANDRIRLMTVANATAPAPQETLPLPVKWAAASPETVPNFSAACYFFGRELQKHESVPLGLIQSVWSGAAISAFISADALHANGGEDVRLHALKTYAADKDAGMREWGGVVENWWRNTSATPLWANPAASANWAVAPEGLGIWSQWKVPALENFAGHMWLRTSVRLSKDQAEKGARLSLGTITEEDQVWVNGKFTGATFGYGAAREYDLGGGVLHEGDNDILINVYCGWRGCGMFGPAVARAVKFADGSSVPLSGTWRYQQVPASVGVSPRVPWGATAGLTMVYNAMIAPLGPYGLQGVLWYQGESNTYAPQAYRGQMKALMTALRTQFRTPELAFLIVQLPDNGQPPFVPEDSDWSHLREVQRLVVAQDKRAALAVTIDIGDHMGLHPANKQEVGRRLSLAARRLIYGEAALKAGPQPLKALRDHANVRVQFTAINEGLAVAGNDRPIGFELCGVDQKSCRFVSATVQGDTVNLAVPKGFNPTRVRYCWGGGPVCTLYDKTRLPAVPFEIALTP